MREILFKAKRLNDGEWVEGNIVYVAEDADFMPGAYILPRLVSASAAPPTKGIMLGDFFEVDPSHGLRVHRPDRQEREEDF